MDYHEAANFLFGLRRYPPRPGTEATAELLAALGDPQEELACVQVAGSNGKGTVARMVESVLSEAGLRVGVYTSPHFDDVRERVRVDGRPIRKSAVSSFVETVSEYVTDRGAAGDSPTFFETLTAMALREFDRQDVDVAVLEVGIGGRYDATSAVDPVASAVTSVTLEHTDFLGETVAEIARDKAHVAPADGPLVTAAGGDALDAIRQVADDVVTVGDETDHGDGASGGGDGGGPDLAVEYGGRRGDVEAAVRIAAGRTDGSIPAPAGESDGWSIEGRIPLLGAHQARNAGVATALALATAGNLGIELDVETLSRGLRGAHWPGRFEVVDSDPLVVLDGAHNPGACEALAATLSEFDYDALHLLFGALVDKDHAGMVAALPTPDSAVACRPALDRAEHEETLATVLGDAGVDRVDATGSVLSALDTVLDRADPGDCVLVTGSLHTVAEARRRWTRTEVPKDVDSVPGARRVLAAADVSPAGRWRMREKAVHRVVRARVKHRQASRIKEELLSLGGECAVAGIHDDAETVEVVLMGTVAQLRRLAERLQGLPDGLPLVGDRIFDAAGIGTDDAVGAGSARGTRGWGSDPAADRWPWQRDTAVMGICNVTPDSFHDGGEYDTVAEAADRAERLVAAGVDVLDVGGESTRPGADPVPVETEIERVVPVIEEIRERGIDATISVDTRKADVARAALSAGADVVNDVSGLADPEMRFVAAEHDAGLVVMHSVDTPVVPDRDVAYDDVVTDVLEFLNERVLLAERAGVPREDILVDPGLGFGKADAENFELVDRLDEFHALGCPVMVGHSHKSMFELIGREAGERAAPTIAVTALAADRGADLIRVHDGPENVAAVRAALAVNDPGSFRED